MSKKLFYTAHKFYEMKILFKPLFEYDVVVLNS